MAVGVNFTITLTAHTDAGYALLDRTLIGTNTTSQMLKLFHDVSFLAMSCFPGAVLEAPYTETVDHRPPLRELERKSLRIVVDDLTWINDHWITLAGAEQYADGLETKSGLTWA